MADTEDLNKEGLMIGIKSWIEDLNKMTEKVNDQSSLSEYCVKHKKDLQNMKVTVRMRSA